MISLHPSKENFILISSDNRIRLFDIDTETTLMAYTARELSPGTRIDGRFSPCGSFIYSASYDIRTYSGLKKQRKEFDIQRFEANGVLIWKCKGNKLEKSEMNAMADGLLRNGSNVLPATQCRWINFKSKSGKNRKALIVVSLDQSIQLFL